MLLSGDQGRLNAENRRRGTVNGMRTLTYGTTSIHVPEGAHLHVVITGEESEPIDLLPNAALMLDLRPSVPVDGFEDTGVDFAQIDCSDDIVFERDGAPIPHEQALAELAVVIVDSVRSYTEQVLGPDAAGQ